MRRFIPFRYKLTLLISLIVLALISVVFTIIQRNIEKEFRLLITKEMQQTESYVGELMNNLLSRLYSDGFALSNDTLIRTMLTDRTLDEATRMDIIQNEIFPNLLNARFVMVLDANGTMLAHTEVENDILIPVIMESEQIQEMLLGNETAGYLYFDDGYAQFLGLPIFLGQSLQGIVIVGDYLTRESLDTIKEVTHVDMALMELGKVLIHTDWDTDKDHHTTKFVKEFERWLEAHDGDFFGNEEVQKVSLFGERLLMRSVVTSDGFFPPYVIIRSLDKRLYFVNDIRNYTIIIGLVSLAVVTVIGFVFSTGISRPIRHLQAATSEVEKENFAHRVLVRTSDEFALLADSFNSMIAGLAEKKLIRDTLDKSVSSEVADHILAHGVELGGQKQMASILFCDIRGFTSLSEKVSSTELVSLLNRYFSRISPLIQEQQGTIDKYIGDAIMALFGAPVQFEAHALQAVKAARSMIRELGELNKELKQEFDVTLDIGIGINSGEVVAGMVGSENRLNYTALGDAVNLASRLEGLCKYYGSHIIISGHTLEHIADPAREGLHFRMLDIVRVKGKREGCTVYDVLTLADYDKAALEAFKLYEQAVEHVRHGGLKQALELLEKAAPALPDDKPLHSFMSRVKYYMENPQFFELAFEDGIHIIVTK